MRERIGRRLFGDEPSDVAAEDRELFVTTLDDERRSVVMDDDGAGSATHEERRQPADVGTGVDGRIELEEDGSLERALLECASKESCDVLQGIAIAGEHDLMRRVECGEAVAVHRAEVGSGVDQDAIETRK